VARIVTAFDIGHDSVKAVSVRSSPGVSEIVRVATMPLEELGRLDDGAEKFAALRARVGKFVKQAGIDLGECVIGMSGRTTMLRYIPIPPVPPWRLDAMMRFEATEQTTTRVGAEESGTDPGCAHDYRVLDTPDIEGQSMVLLAVSQDASVKDRVAVMEAAGVLDPDVELTATALYNAYINGNGYEDDFDKTVLLLDVGSHELNIVLTRSGGLYFARHQNGGGAQFTKAVCDVLEIPWAEAEKLKCEKGRVLLENEGGKKSADDEGPDEGSSSPSSDDEIEMAAAPGSERVDKACEALTDQASDLARVVEATIMYARAQVKVRDIKVDKLLLSGGGSKLTGLPEFLAGRLGLAAAPLEPLKKVSLGAMSVEDMKPLEGSYSAYAVPIGLALSRIVPFAPSIDLRRPAAKAVREYRQRDLYLWAAAGLLVLALIFWVASGLRESVVVSRAKDNATKLAEADETTRRNFDTAKRRNDRLRADVEALRERVTSGEDLLRVLSQLKKQTPDTLRLTELSTSRPKLAGQTGAGTITFQSERIVYLRGLATNTTSLAEAFRAVTAYQRSLEEMHELFSKVEQLVLHDTGAEKPHVAEFVVALTIARSQ
jgi:type IV pilus assembly protein PilM